MSKREWKSLKEVSELIYSCVGSFYKPKTTRQIQLDLEKKGRSLHWHTINKRLEIMAKSGEIKKLENGFNFWVRDKND